MTMNREYLDETIDRVAREMTMAGTVAFALDGWQSRQGSRQSGRSLVVLTAAAAGVVMAGLLSMWQDMPPADVRAHTLASRALAPVSALPAAPRQAIDAAPTPRLRVSLAVAPLSIEPLSIGAMADVEPLNVKDMAIADIPSGDEKEHR
jgi:hypothetical protein